MSGLKRSTLKLQESRPTLRVGSSWHYRVYQWWLDHGGYWPSNKTENLCHYMRVVLIWAAWRWFTVVPIAGFVTPLEILLGIGMILVILTAILVLILFTPLDIFVSGVAVIGSLLLTLFILSALADHINRFLRWFFLDYYKWRVVRPITFFALISIAVAGYILGPELSGQMLILFGLILLGVALMGVLILGLIFIADKVAARAARRRYNHPRKSLKTSDFTKQKGTSIWVLLWEFIKATKNRFMCPVIYLPGTETSSTDNPLNL